MHTRKRRLAESEGSSLQGEVEERSHRTVFSPPLAGLSMTQPHLEAYHFYYVLLPKTDPPPLTTFNSYLPSDLGEISQAQQDDSQVAQLDIMQPA